MSGGLNKVLLIGNLGTDPEVRELQSGGRMATFSLATSRKWKDRDGNEQEATEWHRVKVWGKLVDVVEQYTFKGSRVYVEGRIEYDTFEDREGNTRYFTDIVIFQLLLLGDPKGGGAAPGRPQAAPAPQQAPTAPTPAPRAPAPRQVAPTPPPAPGAQDAYVTDPPGTPHPPKEPIAPAPPQPGRQKKWTADDLPF